jgi:hypothetical protein
MKLFLAFVLAFAVHTVPAFAYSSASHYDPNFPTGTDVETKVVKRSQVATYSDAIPAGAGVYYSETELPYLSTVSLYYSGTGIDQISADFIAGVATRSVATGSNAGFQIVTRGYVGNALFDASGGAIALDGALCVSRAADATRGKLIACTGGVRSPIHALEAKASGSGTMKVVVHSK